MINLDIKNITGLDNFSLNKTSVIVSNHNCLLDIFCIPQVLNRNVVSLISSRIVYKPGRRKDLVDKYLYSMPIEAHGGRKYSDMCLAEAINLVKLGYNVNIFPEGAYIVTNNIYRGRTGAARILFESAKDKNDIDLVPISIDIAGLDDDLDTLDAKGKEVSINILEPIDYHQQLDKYLNGNIYEKNEALHDIIDSSMKNIAKSLNRNYVNQYIELYKKGNVMFSSSEKVDTDLAQDLIYINQYKDELEERRKMIIKKFNCM